MSLSFTIVRPEQRYTNFVWNHATYGPVTRVLAPNAMLLHGLRNWYERCLSQNTQPAVKNFDVVGTCFPAQYGLIDEKQIWFTKHVVDEYDTNFESKNNPRVNFSRGGLIDKIIFHATWTDRSGKVLHLDMLDEVIRIVWKEHHKEEMMKQSHSATSMTEAPLPEPEIVDLISHIVMDAVCEEKGCTTCKKRKAGGDANGKGSTKVKSEPKY